MTKAELRAGVANPNDEIRRPNDLKKRNSKKEAAAGPGEGPAEAGSLEVNPPGAAAIFTQKHERTRGPSQAASHEKAAKSSHDEPLKSEPVATGRETGAGPGVDLTGSDESDGSDKKVADKVRDKVTDKVGMSPRDLLLPYQRRYADDETRFKVGLMGRQIGKDFTSAEEGVRDIYTKELRKEKTGWLIGAPSERQSIESLEKWKEWTEAYKLAIADVIEEREGKGSEALLKSATIVFPGGSRVMAVPGKPETVRGFSMNVLLTEFAFFEKPDETLRAVMPSITNPLRGGLKKFRVISTPNGIGNKFHDLCKGALPFGSPELARAIAEGRKGIWSLHKVTIWDAVQQGLPIDPEEIRLALNDPEGWAQEYECQFLDQASVLLAYELIALCESVEATEVMPIEYWRTRGDAPVYLGIDFGRKRDLTVCWAVEKVSDLQITKEVLCLEKMSTPDQVDALRPRIQKARRVCLDYTGPGVGLGDYLVKEFGEWKPEEDKFGKVELVTMSNPVKVDLFSKERMEFENRRERIPISRVIREDFHSMYRVVTPSGNITYRAPHTEDGHADRLTAKALCTRAAAGIFGGAINAENMKDIVVAGQVEKKPTWGRRLPVHEPRRLQMTNV